MKQVWKAALAQMDSGADEKKNRECVKRMISEAVRQGAELVVFPETVDYIGRDMKGHAKEIPGEWDAFFARQAAEHRIYIHGGSLTQRQKGRLPANTSLFFDPEGRQIGRYQKLHMFDVTVEDGPSFRESAVICPGRKIVTADTELGCFGLSICYDLRFPELYRILAKEGAQILVNAANFTDPTGRLHWEPLLRARAIENACYVLACCQCGQKPEFQAHGHSMIISPLGEIMAQAGDKEELIFADIDLDYLRQVRRQIPSLQNVREDVYRLERV